MENTNKFCTLLVSGAFTQTDDSDYIKRCYYALGKEKVCELAKNKKILPFAAKTLSLIDADAGFWKDILDKYAARNNKIIEFLDKAYAAMETEGVKKVFLSENFGALLAADGDTALFASGDVDNYAPAEEKEKIYAAMRSIGCKIKERYAVKHQIAAEFFPDKKFSLPENFYFSLDFYPLARLKLPCFIKADNFVNWSKLAAYRDTHIKLAPPEALAYICLMHVSLHSFLRAPDTRLYVDLYNVSRLNPDYAAVAKWCRRDKTCTRAAVAARLSNKIMHTDIPGIITENGRNTDKLTEYVYDKKENCLKREPNKLKIMKIDIMCNDKSDLCGIGEIIFPDTEWMKKTYGSSGVTAHLKHFKRIF